MKGPIVTVLTDRLDESAVFYREVLGFEEHCRVDHPGVALIFLRYGQMVVELVQREQPAPKPGGGVILTFVTDAFEPVARRCRAHGIALSDPMVLPSGLQMLRFSDPNGVPVSFVIESER